MRWKGIFGIGISMSKGRKVRKTALGREMGVEVVSKMAALWV